MKSSITGLLAIAMFCGAIYFSMQDTRPAFIEQHKIKKTGRSGALEALEFWTASRAYPDNDIPAQKYEQAFIESKRRLKEVSRSPFSNYDWEFLGPVNLAGRTIALALNPINGNTLYAGSASGGLWRSYTGGVNGNWERVSTGFPVLGVNSIAIDPADTNTMYIGTGEVYRYTASLGGTVVRTTRGSYGMGILKTTNNGQTWVKSLDWSYSNMHGVQVIKIHPNNTQIVWAGTTDGVYKTTDGGATWGKKFFLPTMDLLIHQTNPETLMISCGNFAYTPFVLRSNDGGENWDGLILPFFTGKTMLGMSKNNPDIVYASVADSTTGVGSLHRSTNFGLSWTQVRTFTEASTILGVQGWYSHYVAVHPNDPNLIVHAGVSSSRSTNGGSSFGSVSGGYSDRHAYAIHPTNPNILYDANDDGVYRSTNFGSSYTQVSDGYNTGQFYNGFSNSTTDSLLAMGQVQDHIPGYGYTGSATWSRTAKDEVGWTAITPGNDLIQFAIYRGGGAVYRSTGSGFGSVFSVGGNGAWCSPVVVSPATPSVVYFGKDKIYKSTNSGATGSWTATNSNTVLDGNPALSMAAAPSNADYVYVGTAPYTTRANIWKTSDGGTTWLNITGTLPNRYPNDIAVDPVDPLIAYVAFGGFGAGHFFKTTNGGASWANITGSLPDIPGTAVMVDPLNPNYIFAGNDIGVYVSTDAGATWNGFSDGLPEAVLVSDITYSASNRALRVATHGNGVFERKLPQTFPAVSMVSPNGNEEWEAGYFQTITWSTIFVGSVNLEYTTNNGVDWNTIAEHLPSSPSSYSWYVPVTLSDVVKVRVSSATNSSINDASDDVFSIYFEGKVVTQNAGWNLVSVPMLVNDAEKTDVFPPASSLAFAFEGSYVARELLNNGEGYWLKFNADVSIPIHGDSLFYDTIDVVEGWNIIGSLTLDIPTSSITSEPPSIIESDFYGYTQGYYVAGIIRAGKGYWVKVNAPGKLILSTSPGATGKLNPSLALENQYNHLTIKDANGFSQTLYFGSQAQSINANKGILPPPPPSGAFDVRFTSQRMLEIVNDDKNIGLPILMNNAAFPVSVSWKIHSSSQEWVLQAGGNQTVLHGTGTTTIQHGSATEQYKLAINNASREIPKKTEIAQNYPNPFNPSTQIRFDLAEESEVTLKIFDALGREVETLSHEMMKAGSYSVPWNASHLPSGVYIVQMNANALSYSRKLLLMK